MDDELGELRVVFGGGHSIVRRRSPGRWVDPVYCQAGTGQQGQTAAGNIVWLNRYMKSSSWGMREEKLGEQEK